MNDKKIDIREYNIRTIAYIGDAVYELYVREHIVRNSRETANKLHKKGIKYVSAKSQEKVIDHIMSMLNEDEISVYKRGRNAGSNTVPKNTDLVTYKKATGFECIVGYLYLEEKQDRLDELIYESLRYIDEGVV